VIEVLAAGIATAFAGYFFYTLLACAFRAPNSRVSGGYRMRDVEPKFIRLNDESK
jgi:hypothetical protein